MKIAIVAPSPVPFLIGGAEKLYWGLHRHMNQLTPHEVELIKVPCRDQEFWPLMEGYLRFSYAASLETIRDALARIAAVSERWASAPVG